MHAPCISGSLFSSPLSFYLCLNTWICCVLLGSSSRARPSFVFDYSLRGNCGRTNRRNLHSLSNLRRAQGKRGAQASSDPLRGRRWLLHGIPAPYQLLSHLALDESPRGAALCARGTGIDADADMERRKAYRHDMRPWKHTRTKRLRKTPAHKAADGLTYEALLPVAEHGIQTVPGNWCHLLDAGVS